MKTTLNADGNIGIPAEIRETDHLTAGDSFELERLIPGPLFAYAAATRWCVLQGRHR